MPQVEQLLSFWLDELGPEGWYKGGADIDRRCTELYGEATLAARRGAFRDWLGRPRGALAYMILTDQLPRNIYRDTADAFATDPLARSGASIAISLGHDKRIEGIARQFFYMPFEHSESTQDQAFAVALFLTRMPEDTHGNLVHARAHRDIIRRFGRFPFRNQALGRTSSADEQKFLAEEGYRGVVERLSA